MHMKQRVVAPGILLLCILAAGAIGWLLFAGDAARAQGATGVASHPVAAQSVGAIPLSATYTVRVDGADVPVYTTPCRLQDNALANCAFASFDIPASGPVGLEIVSAGAVQAALVRPLARNITPTVAGNTARFTLTNPSKLYIEFNGDRSAPLLLFANQFFTKPDPSTPKLTVFGPGVHQMGHRILQNDETIVIEAGAIVQGTFYGENVRNVRIIGRGILDGSITPHKEHLGIELRGAQDIEISGIIISDSPHWTVVLRGVERGLVSNVKIINQRGNGDGIDIANSRQVNVDDCFVYSSDDASSIKGTNYFGYSEATNLPVDNVTVKNSFFVVGNTGYGIRIGDETQAPYIRNVRYENIDILSFVGGPIGIVAADRAPLENLVFKDIRVEEHRGWVAEIIVRKTDYSQDSERAGLTV